MYSTTMDSEISIEHKLFRLIKELGITIRLFQQEAIFCEGITFTQFSILDFVAESGTLRLSDLHGLLSVEKSTTTRLVDPIVKQGLLERISSEEDPRAIILKITKKGKDIHKKVWSCISEFMDGIMNEFPKGKADDVINTVRIFTRACNNYCKCECKTTGKG